MALVSLLEVLLVVVHFSVFSHQYRFSQLFDDKVYHVDGQKRTFQDAQQYCVENGHRLLRIESQLEQDWIVDKLQGVAVPFPVWLDVVKYGDTYYWSDQRGILWNNWDDYSRSQCSGVCRVYLSEHRNRNPYDPYSAQLAIGTWLAMDTTEAHTVVCEEPYLVTAPDTVFKVTNGQQSDSETLTAQLGVKLYYMPLQYMTRINAEIYCNLQHDHVARVTNFAEQTWLQANMAEGSRFWTGAQLEAANASHISIRWPPDGDAVTWTNWEDGEPLCSSDCSVLVDKNGKWITKPLKGSMVSKTICERDLFKSINDRISEMQLTSGKSPGLDSETALSANASTTPMWSLLTKHISQLQDNQAHFEAILSTMQAKLARMENSLESAVNSTNLVNNRSKGTTVAPIPEGASGHSFLLYFIVLLTSFVIILQVLAITKCYKCSNGNIFRVSSVKSSPVIDETENFSMTNSC